MIDKDEDGFLERFELVRVLEKQGVKNMGEVEEVLDELEDEEGRISIAHYVNHMIKKK